MDDAERFWAKVDKSGECWEWTAGLRGNGYGQFWMNGTNVMSHRFSYVLHHPLTIDLLEHREICVCHRCDNPKCVNPAHLFLGSQGDNMRDRETKGRANRTLEKGEKHPSSKLTEDDVREIRIKYANGGVSQRQLALEYGITKTNIGTIILRKSWSHI
jgi:hypothetical protein